MKNLTELEKKIKWSKYYKHDKSDINFWSNVCQTKHFISEEFIDEFHDRFNLDALLMFQHKYIFKDMWRTFFEKYSDYLNWNWVSMFESLSFEFMRKYEDRLNWDFVSYYHKFSEKFIEEFKDKINWESLQQKIIQQKIHVSKQFLKKYKIKIYLSR